MKILAIGDIIGPCGCDFVRKNLANIKKQYDIDLVIANGENSAQGNGILPSSANHLISSGVDVITTGNHTFKRREIIDYLDEHEYVLRPANYPDAVSGNGYYIFDSGRYRVCVISLLGTVYLENLDNPFTTADKIIEKVKDDCDYIIIDFHAEATGEKVALAHYLDGRVTAVVGTHTHVQTADETILPNSTAYITDLGMTGPIHSALGIDPKCVIERFLYHTPTRFYVSENPVELQGAIIETDDTTKKAVKIERFKLL